MSKFRGSFTYSIDSKGRINMPAKFRKVLRPEADETFVIIRGPNQCLQVFPQDSWSAFEDELESRPQTPETIKYKRYLYRSISDSKLDGQGRISLSNHQMSTAGITEKVIVEGQGSHIEIWSPENYESYFGDEDSFDEVYFQSVQDSRSDR